MARGGDMREVELLDGDDVIAEQPDPPAHDRRRLWWIPAGVVAVVLSLAGVQWVVDSREDAAVERLAAVPGVFPPLGDELEVVRALSETEAAGFWAAIEIGGTRTAALVVAQDGSQSVTAVDHRTAETLWSTPLVGPSAERAASPQSSYGGGCQGDAPPGRDAAVAVCLATDGFVRYADDGTEQRFPATASRVVVVDTSDGHVLAEWDVERASQLVLVDGLVVVGSRDVERGAVVVAYDLLTGDERWRDEEPSPTSGPGASEERYWGLVAIGDVVGVHDRAGLTLLSATGSRIREDLGSSSADTGFGTDPLTGTFSITSYGGTDERTTTLLAPDADPAGDVVLRGELVQLTVDDGSLPGLVLTSLSHAYAWDRRTGEQLWEADVQPGYSALVVRGRVYLTSSTEILSLDGHDGEVLWRRPLPDLRQGVLGTDGRDLLLLTPADDGSDGGRVTLLDLATGDQIRYVPYPEGISEIQSLHGVILGWSDTTQQVSVLQ